jgi:hypothetical protein
VCDWPRINDIMLYHMIIIVQSKFDS